MTNNVSNYYSHILHDPSYYQRDYELDLPQVEQTSWAETVKRITLIALPFLSFYKPFGFVISATLGASRVVTHLVLCWRTWTMSHLAQLTLALLAFTCTFVRFELGLLVTTLSDAAVSAASCVYFLWGGGYAQGVEAFLHTLSSLLYLSILTTGALEVIFFSLLVQALIHLYEVYREHEKGRWPEMIAKMVLSLLRLYQAHDLYTQILRRDFFLKMETFASLIQRIQKGQQVDHLIDSPLSQEKAEVQLFDAEGKPFVFGAHFHGTGRGVVKGLNLEFHKQGETTQLIFKVNHLFRDRLELLMSEMKDLNQQQVQECLQLLGSHAKNVEFSLVPMPLFSDEKQSISFNSAWKISFEGLGTIFVGASPDCSGLYDLVKVEIPEEKNLYRLHELLSFFNLDETLCQARLEDIERLKMGHLFRIFYPKEATLLERQERFFTLSLEELRAEMIQKAPLMEEAFKTHLPQMELREILPGRLRYGIPGLADEVHKLGGRALIATVTGVWEGGAFERTASILKMGMLSTEMRYRHGIMTSGLSSGADFYLGSSDSVFTQFLTKNNFENRLNLRELYWGDVKILFSLKALETGSYQYHFDNFGTRQMRWGILSYLHRPDIFSFAQGESQDFNSDNEVMLKERIDPSMVTGLIVPDQNVRDGLLAHLKSVGLVCSNAEGMETILGTAVQDFIHIGRRLDPKWAELDSH